MSDIGLPDGTTLILADAPASAGGPCEPWPIDTSCWNLPDDVDPDVIAGWQAVSTQLLWGLSGRRWGTCPVEVRPCRRACMDPWPIWRGGFPYGARWVPYFQNGVWRNASVCGCGSSCSCGELCEVYLAAPVASIIEVTIDGAVIDPDSYRVDAPGWLVRQDGGCWPTCQDLSAPADEEGTFVVRYEWGLEPDAAAIAANSAYTLEFVKACTPGCSDCQLSKRVTNVIQQGYAMQLIDPQEFLQENRTGVYVVDQWLNVVNPENLPAPPRVRSPDFRGPRTTIIPPTFS